MSWSHHIHMLDIFWYNPFVWLLFMIYIYIVILTMMYIYPWTHICLDCLISMLMIDDIFFYPYVHILWLYLTLLYDSSMHLFEYLSTMIPCLTLTCFVDYYHHYIHDLSCLFMRLLCPHTLVHMFIHTYMSTYTLCDYDLDDWLCCGMSLFISIIIFVYLPWFYL